MLLSNDTVQKQKSNKNQKIVIMAHNLEIRDGKASFVAKGEVAWHGLGTYVENAMTAAEVIDLARNEMKQAKRK